MAFAMTELKIPDTANVQITPRIIFHKELGHNGFTISDFVKIPIIDSTQVRTEHNLIIRQKGPKRVLKPTDTTFILSQNKRAINNFVWDLDRLGLKKNDGALKIYYSLPYFTEDRNLAIIFIEIMDNSNFKEGAFQLFCFKKKENGWDKVSVELGLY